MNSLRRTCIFVLGPLCLAGASASGAPSVMGSLVNTGVLGDVNNDGIADARDQAVVQANLGKTGGLSMGDVNGDGTINSTDLSLITSHYRAPRTNAYFGKIADSATYVPGSTAARFYSFDAPSMDRTLNLAFFGNAGTTFGIYRYGSGSVLKVADDTTLVPGGNQDYSYLIDPVVVGSKIVFYGKDTNTNPTLYGSPGIYASVNSAAPTIIVNKNTARPEGGTFSSFSDLDSPHAMGNATIFKAGSSIYSVVGTSAVAKVADTSTYVPGSTTVKFSSFNGQVTDGTNFYFVGQSGTTYGIYKKSGSTLTTLIDSSASIPGIVGRLSNIQSLATDGTNFSFLGTINASKVGIFGLINNTLTRIADQSTLVPGGAGKFTGFGTSSIGGSAVAFVGSDSNYQPGIYAWIQGQIVRVIDTSVLLNGKMISGLDISDEAVAGNRVAFKATFTDGTNGVFVASILAPWAPGDLNGDGKTTKLDYAVLQKNLGQPGTRATGDLDGDGMITVADLQILERYGNATYTTPLLGDVDGNGKVDSYDAKIVMKNIGKYGTPAQGDFDLDGLITLSDLQIVESQLGKTGTVYQPFGAVSAGADVPDVTMVPEPGAMSLLALLGSLALLRRRRA